MPPLFLKLLALSFLSLLTSTTSTTTTTAIGVTYNPSSSATTPNFPTPEQVASTLINTLHISAVHLLDPTPAAIRAFAYSNISLLLTLPNHLISSFADNRSNAAQWVYTYVLPFHPRARISLISLGEDVVSSPSDSSLDPTSDPSTALLHAMRNLQQSLLELGLKNIPVSTTFSYISVMTTTFPPSSSEFQEPISSLLVRPVLQFLDENNSSFLIDVHPYNVYRLRSLVPVGFALFQDVPYNFRDDAITGARYRNLFDMMVDGVITALAIDGYQDLPVVVTKTGWPSSSGGEGGGAEISPAFSQMYLNGLISHLRSGLGTPLKKDAVAQVYIYDLFDGSNNESKGESWGILNPNLTMKFKVDFSSSASAFAHGMMDGITYGEAIWFHVLFGILVWKFLMTT